MLKVTYLNADTSSLLSFSSAASGLSPSDARRKQVTIVIDPWLRGSTTILCPLFYKSTHSVQPTVSSLSDIDEPSIVLITHDKPDHCHKETLTTLSPNVRSVILAVPSAAKLIRSWNHFKAENVLTLPKFDSASDFCVYRHAVPSTSSSGCAGELTIAYIAPDRDISGLRVAIGITYRPPKEFSQHKADNGSMAYQLGSTDHSLASQNELPQAEDIDKTLSVLYSPHGLPYKILKPYVESYLAANAALPLSLLMHCFRIIRNPFYLGGLITTGAIGGSEIAKKTRARYWVSVHDEEKNDRGFSISESQITQYSVEEVQRLIHEWCQDPIATQRFPKVFELSSGEEYTIS